VPVDRAADGFGGGVEVGFTFGGGGEGSRVDVGEGAGKFVGREGEESFVGAELGVILLHGRDVEVEGDIHETACVGEAEIGAEGKRATQAGQH